MRAAFLYGPRDIRVEEFDIPKPKADRVLVRIKASTLCPTDIRKYLGHVKIPLPAVLGHEGAGVVGVIGDEVTSVREGDRVWISSIIYTCGRCKYCRRGQTNLCDGLVGLGFSGGSPEKCAEVQKEGTVGVFSEYTMVPENAVIKIPKEISFEEASMIEPFCAVLKSVETCRVGSEDVAVIGCGPLGLLHVQVAKAFGASKVIASDPIEDRRATALEFGADEVIDPTKVDPIAKVKELTNGAGTDVVIVATGGSAEATCTEQAMQIAAKGGRINIFAGTYPRRDLAIDPNMIHYRELVLTATFGYVSKHPYEAIKLIQQKKVRVDAVRHPIFPLDEIQKAFEVYGKPGALKVGINM